LIFLVKLDRNNNYLKSYCFLVKCYSVLWLAGYVAVWRRWSFDWTFSCFESWLQVTSGRQLILYSLPGATYAV